MPGHALIVFSVSHAQAKGGGVIAPAIWLVKGGNSRFKEGVKLTKSELSNAWSTTQKTSSYGNPAPRPLSQIITPKGLKRHHLRRVKTDDTAPEVAPGPESACVPQAN